MRVEVFVWLEMRDAFLGLLVFVVLFDLCFQFLDFVTDVDWRFGC